jgi:hypothetical protein
MSGFRQLPLISCGRAAKAIGMFLYQREVQLSIKEPSLECVGGDNLIVVNHRRLIWHKRVASRTIAASWVRWHGQPRYQAPPMQSLCSSFWIWIGSQKKSEEKGFQIPLKNND